MSISGEDDAQVIESKWKWLLILSACMALNMLVQSSIWMVLPVFFSTSGLSNGETGILMAIGTSAGTLTIFVSGWISDRIGRKPLLILSISGYSLMFAIFYFFQSFSAFVFGRMAAAFIYVSGPICYAMLADVFLPSNRGTAMGIYAGITGAGSIFGPIISGLLIGNDEFSKYMIFCALVNLACGIIVTIFIKESHKTVTSMKKSLINIRVGFSKSSFNKLSSLRIKKNIGLFYLARTICNFGFNLSFAVFSIYLIQVFNMNMLDVGFFFSVQAVITLIFSPIIGSLSDRWGRKLFLIIGTISLSFSFFVLAQANTFELLVLAKVIQSICAAILVPTENAYLSEILSRSATGGGIGTLATLSTATLAIGSAIAGFLAELFGFISIFLIGILTSILSVLLLLLIKRKNGETREPD